MERRILFFLTAIAAALSVLSLLGWIAGIRFLTSIHEEYFPMPPSTAIGLLLTSGSMLTTAFWPGSKTIRTFSRLVNIVIVVLAFMIIYEFFAGISPGLEERLTGLSGELNGIPIGRMSPIAAVLFFVTNMALLVFRFTERHEILCRSMAATMALVVLLVGAVTTLGYLYGTPFLYGGSTRPVAPTAGFAFALLGAGLIAAAGKSSWPLRFFSGPSVRAQMLRSLLPIIAGLIIVDSWLGLFAKDQFDVNPALLSALLSLLFMMLAAALIIRSAQRIGGTVDRANEARDRAERIMRLRLQLMEYAYTHSMEQLLQKTLDEVCELTDSPIGFYHFVEPDQKTLSLQAWSTRTIEEFCTAEGKGHQYDVEEAGVWVDCIYQRKPVIHNDYNSLPNRKGLPAGHAEVIRELVVPIFRGDKVVAILGVGNKPSNYVQEDVELVTYLADVAWEISDRKRSEEHVRKLNQELQRSNEELELFAYVASHDLQEPLRMVTSYMQLLEKRYAGQLDNDAKEFIDFAVDGADRMHVMINDLLTLSRVGTRGKPFKPVDSGKILDQAIADLGVAIGESGAEVTHGPLPHVMADPGQLAQLFMNLLGNAIKFRGDDAPSIHVSADKKDGEWVFSVRDNGIGIDSRYAAKIFVIFQRLHGRKSYPGTGIGLAVCKKIVERHGGRIWVDSEPGKGSRFYFSMPEMEVDK